MRARTLLLGLLLTVLAVGVWILTSVLELGSVNALVAVVAGVVLALVRDGSPLVRYGAFLIGLILGLLALIFGLAGWIGWVVAILLLTVISALTKGKLPLWAMILGSGTLAAVYEPYLFGSPWYFFTQFPTSLLVTLAASAGGFLAAVLVELLAESAEEAVEEHEQEQKQPELVAQAAAPSPAAGTSEPADSMGDQQ